MRPSLIIAGIELSIISWLDYDQQFEPIGGSSLKRMAVGTPFKMTHWQKFRINISAGGWKPPALLAVDYSAPFEIELPMPVVLNPGEVLPAGWSSRAAPFGERTVTDTAGNSIRYVYPKMMVIAEPPRQRSGHGSSPSWEFVCEEF